MSALGVYRALLWCYPAPFRKEYAQEMAGAFAEQVRHARAQGGWVAELGVWARTLGDLCITAPREHRHVLKQDLRYALRTFAANPVFAAVAVMSLALGIGANTAIFSLLSSVALTALPVREPQQLVVLTNPASSGVNVGSDLGERNLLTYAEFEQLRDRTTAFSAVLASQSAPDRLQARVGGGEPEELLTRLVSAEYFTTLGVHAFVGRAFTASDASVEGAAPYAVISYDFWQRRFGGRPDVLGTRLTIRRGVFSIVGVAPSSFFGETVGQRPDVWLPLTMQAAVLPGRDWLRDVPLDLEKVMWLQAIGRLRPGKTLEQAQAEANLVFKQGLAAFYGSAGASAAGFADQRLRLRPAPTGVSQIREQFAEPLRMLLAAAAVVLLIACANLGNLLLARTTARSREMSVRLALGASRGRLIRQLLTESLCLAVMGGLVGLAVAYLLRSGLLQLVSSTIVLPARPDARVLAFVFALTIGTGVILGLLPALRTTRVDAVTGLREQGRGLAGSAAWLRISKVVVVLQLALSLPLLVGSGLLLRTLFNLQRVDLGFAKERLLLVRVDARSGGYPETAALPLFEQLLERIRSAPGVHAASYSANGLFSGRDSADDLEVEGYTPKGDGDRGARYDHVGPGYFSTLGIPLVLGREIADRDHGAATRVCIINESFARLFFEGRSPLGLHITQVFGSQRTTFQIVGVSRNSRSNRLRGDIEPRFFVPVAQPINVRTSATFLIRTKGDAAGGTNDVRRIIQRAAPALPITFARPLAELMDAGMVQDRLLANLSVAFGGVGLLLAAIGLYGVLSYGVTRRTNEIGIRKALGAQHRAVMAMVLRETGLLLVVGLVSGAGLSALVIQLIASRLYGLAPTDPAALMASVLLLAGVALAATALPAYRASRIDPLVALRHE
jgi:predicted permease